MLTLKAFQLLLISSFTVAHLLPRKSRSGPNYLQCQGSAPLPESSLWPPNFLAPFYPTLRDLCAPSIFLSNPDSDRMPSGYPNLGCVCWDPSGTSQDWDCYSEYADQMLWSSGPLWAICRAKCACHRPTVVVPDNRYDPEEVIYSPASGSRERLSTDFRTDQIVPRLSRLRIDNLPLDMSTIPVSLSSGADSANLWSPGTEGTSTGVLSPEVRPAGPITITMERGANWEVLRRVGGWERNGTGWRRHGDGGAGGAAGRGSGDGGGDGGGEGVRLIVRPDRNGVVVARPDGTPLAVVRQQGLAAERGSCPIRCIEPKSGCGQGVTGCVCSAERVGKRLWRAGRCGRAGRVGQRGWKRSLGIGACACNATYVSQGCCGGEELIWESQEAWLGEMVRNGT